MKQNVFSFKWLGILVLFVILFNGFIVNYQSNYALKTRGQEPAYKVYALELPDTLNFATEKVPLSSPDLKERLDRELLVNTYWQSNMMLMLKRANKYFPTIEKILAEEGVPSDLKYISVIESGLVNAISPAGAKGFWQMFSTPCYL